MDCFCFRPLAYLQELKELTRMRLAREKLTQEEVSKVQVARDALTAYRQSLYPDSEESRRPITDHQMFTMLQEMDPQSQNEVFPRSPDLVPEQAVKAAAPATTMKDKAAQNALFSLRRRVRAVLPFIRNTATPFLAILDL
jgi:hypothetical protein